LAPLMNSLQPRTMYQFLPKKNRYKSWAVGQKLQLKQRVNEYHHKSVHRIGRRICSQYNSLQSRFRSNRNVKFKSWFGIYKKNHCKKNLSSYFVYWQWGKEQHHLPHLEFCNSESYLELLPSKLAFDTQIHL
jgi:hypothetical protein